MNTHQPSQIRHWTRELELIRRRVSRINLREDDALASRMMAECLSKCEILLEELARGEEESDRLRRLATAERGNWQRLFDVMPLACVLTDAQGIVRGVNRAGALLLNVSSSRLQGQMFLHFVIDRQRLFDALDEHGDGTSLMRVQVRVRPREKALIEVEVGVIADAANTGDRLWFLMPTTATQYAQSGRRSLSSRRRPRSPLECSRRESEGLSPLVSPSVGSDQLPADWHFACFLIVLRQLLMLTDRTRPKENTMAEAGTLHDAFIDELRDTYDAEKQLTKALPKQSGDVVELRTAFESHSRKPAATSSVSNRSSRASTRRSAASTATAWPASSKKASQSSKKSSTRRRWTRA